MNTTPRAATAAQEAEPRLIEGTDERFTGYGVMGLPYASDHYLALRAFVATSVGPAYRAIWHRAPDGRWEIFTTVEPELSCPRYFGSVAPGEHVPAIDMAWPDDWTCEVKMGDRLSWRMNLASTPATRMMSAAGGAMPDGAWNSDAVLASMGPMAAAFLGIGRTKLHGNTPNGPLYKAAPQQVWRVIGGRALLDGEDLGRIGPLPEQTHLADFWLPQRGIFFVGRASFSPVLTSTAVRN
ncbi:MULTISPECIES: hypothetical protein [unclassified Microbacterium]|uniref:hypothetical protein n=1 Tax=unclassified Microbacterium TaxID=2609290 RepID=UPI001D286AA4|nr:MULTISPECIES: hypothetical protein [unclassified Microbacterium]CAH0172157.1 hypothetical protein SRABI121_01778 [Microbacterium sp. Bi121]HWK77894.1 hypothetical protein [Microbacterium sp.]